MTPPKRALFIGRFQPFHLGHRSVVSQIAHDGYDEAIIALGSAQYSSTPENPLTTAQRREIIQASLHDLDTPRQFTYRLIDIPDIHNDDAWVDHVLKLVHHMYGNIHVSYTGNERTARLFAEANHVVRPVEFVVQISATEIRNMLKEQKSDWKEFVHPDASTLIEQYLRT